MRSNNFYQFSILIFSYLCILQTCGFSVGKLGSKDKIEVLKKCDPCPKGIRCVPPIQCPAHVRMAPQDRPQLCDLPAGTHGYCCTSGYNHTASKETHLHHNHVHSTVAARSLDEGHHHVRHDKMDKLELKHLSSMIEEARSEISHALNKEKTITAKVDKSDPSYFHNLVFRSSHQGLMKAIDLSHRALEQVYTSRIFKKREHIPTEEFELNLVDAELTGTPLESGCDHKTMCPSNSERYRSPDGKCNNPLPGRSGWGAAGSPMERLLPPSYNDGIWEPRLYSRDGSPLTNSRTVSRELFMDVDRPHPLYNLLFMQFGQFITHDVTKASSITTADGKSVSCCSEDGSSVLPPQMTHYACMPIVIEAPDDFYTQFNQGCMNFVRSALSVDNQCKLGYGKQLSKVTHYLDGSVIYGSSTKTQGEVRSFQRGMLRISEEYGRSLLPLSDKKKTCGLERPPCFFSGDGRTNQLISLAAVHTLFLREHNRVAAILGDLNRHWNDERLFQETRRIIIAKLQHIVYSEWLPYVIGADAMQRFELNCQQHGYSQDYDSDVNACVTSEFTTAAFRFGHSTVDGQFVIHNGPKVDEIIQIPDVMFNAKRLHRSNFYDEMFNTLTTQPMQQVDSVVTHGLSWFMFRGNKPFGLDLAAINIHRSRDHAIRTYNDYLEATGHECIHDFNEFGYEAARKLSQVYKHPDDIDLWVGGLMESARGDALLGPTFGDIIADQFSRFRRGDRYFYEHSPDINPGYMTEDQLHEIRLSSMARLICDNADGIALRAVAPRAFIRPDVAGNAPASCDNTMAIPRVNYRAWKEGGYE